MTPPPTRRPGSYGGTAITPTDARTISDDAVPSEQEDPVTGVHGDVQERMEKRLRNQNRTLDGIRADMMRHQESDERIAVGVSQAIKSLGDNHVALLVDVGDIKKEVGSIGGEVRSLVQVTAQQAAATQAQADATRRAAEAAEALASKERQLVIVGRSQIWKSVLTGVISLAGIVITALLTYLASRK